MCVIAVCEKKLPSLEDLQKMESANGDGAGVAWIENGLVHWRKNLKAEEILDVPFTLPVAIHFRMASIGGVRPELCHPFVVSAQANTDLVGATKKAVLMHNGHWGEWRQFCRNALRKVKGKIPGGSWSDTRALAWLTHIYGPGFLEISEQKVALISPKGITLYGAWIIHEGYSVTNTYFDSGSIWTKKASVDDDYSNFYKGRLSRL